MNKIDLDDLYVTRLLVFLETAPQTNRYYQIVLDKDQFKGVSKAVGSVFGEVKTADDKYEMRLNLSEESYALPDLKEHE